MTIPGPCSGKIQRRKEIPEATQKFKEDKRRQIHGQGADNGIQRGNTKGSRNEKLKEDGCICALEVYF